MIRRYLFSISFNSLTATSVPRNIAVSAMVSIMTFFATLKKKIDVNVELWRN